MAKDSVAVHLTPFNCRKRQLLLPDCGQPYDRFFKACGAHFTGQDRKSG